MFRTGRNRSWGREVTEIYSEIIRQTAFFQQVWLWYKLQTLPQQPALMECNSNMFSTCTSLAIDDVAPFSTDWEKIRDCWARSCRARGWSVPWSPGSRTTSLADVVLDIVWFEVGPNSYNSKASSQRWEGREGREGEISKCVGHVYDLHKHMLESFNGNLSEKKKKKVLVTTFGHKI